MQSRRMQKKKLTIDDIKASFTKFSQDKKDLLKLDFQEHSETNQRVIADALFEELRTNNSLRILAIKNFSFNAEQINILANHIKVNKALQEISLEEIGIDDSSLSELAQAISENISIKTVTVTGKQFKNVGFIETLVFESKVEVIDFSINSFSTAQLQIFVSKAAAILLAKKIIFYPKNTCRVYGRPDKKLQLQEEIDGFFERDRNIRNLSETTESNVWTLNLGQYKYSESLWEIALKCLDKNLQISVIIFPKLQSDDEVDLPVRPIKMNKHSKLTVKSLTLIWVDKVVSLAKSHFKVDTAELVFKKNSYPNVFKVIQSVSNTLLSITDLDVQNCNINDDNLNEMLQHIQNEKLLITSLNLAGNEITAKSMGCLFDFMNNHQSLRNINISNNKLTHVEHWNFLWNINDFLHKTGIEQIVIENSESDVTFDIKKILERNKVLKLLSKKLQPERKNLDLSSCLVTSWHIGLIMNALKKNTQITHITLTDNELNDEDFESVVCEILRQHPITSIDLYKNKITDESIPAILALAKENKSLKELNLTWNEIKGELDLVNQLTPVLQDSVLKHFLVSDEYLNERLKVNINHNRRFQKIINGESRLEEKKSLSIQYLEDFHIHLIIQALQRSPQCTSLSITHCLLGSFQTVIKLIKSIAEAKLKISSFNFSNNEFDDQAVEAILETFLSTELEITELKLSDNTIKDLSAIVNFIKNNKRLEMLDVKGNGFKDEFFFNMVNEFLFATKIEVGNYSVKSKLGKLTTRNKILLGLENSDKTPLKLDCFNKYHIGSLVNYIKSNQEVRSIDLSDNNLDDDFVEALFKALEENEISQIDDLSLAGNEISDKGAKTIKEFLEQDVNLAFFDLSENNIDSEGMKDIATSLKNNKTLLSLNVSDNYFDAGCLNAFFDAFISNKTLVCFFAEAKTKKVKLTDFNIENFFKKLHKPGQRKKRNGALLSVKIGRYDRSFRKDLKKNERERESLYSNKTISAIRKFEDENKKIQSNLLTAVQASNISSLLKAVTQGVSLYTFEKFEDLKFLKYPLHLAVERNKHSVVKVLIERGVMDRKNANGKTALAIAEEKDETELVNILSKASTTKVSVLVESLTNKVAGKKRTHASSSASDEINFVTPTLAAAQNEIKPPPTKRQHLTSDEPILHMVHSNEALFILLENMVKEHQIERIQFVEEFRKLLAKDNSLTRNMEGKSQHILSYAVYCGFYRIMKLILPRPEIVEKNIQDALKIAKNNFNQDMTDRLQIELDFHDKYKLYSVGNSGAIWTHNLNFTYGSRKKTYLEIEGERLQSFLAIRNSYTQKRLQVSLKAQSEEPPFDVLGNPVTACISFAISQGRYLKGSKQLREVVNIPLNFVNEGFFHMGSDEEVDARIIERVKLGGISEDEIPQDRSNPEYNQKLHHGEQSFIEYLTQKENISQIIQQLLKHPQARAAKVYGVVLDIATPRYPCEYCQSSIKAIQTCGDQFLDQLKIYLIQAGFRLPQVSSLRILTRLGAYQQFENKAGDDIFHHSFHLDMRVCRNQVILMKDLTVDEPKEPLGLTQFKSRSAD